MNSDRNNEANDQALGAFLSAHGFSIKEAFIGVIFIGFLWCLAGGGLYHVILGDRQRPHGVDRKIHGGPGNFELFVALGFAALASTLTLMYIREQGHTIELHENGLRSVHRSKKVAVLWGDIKKVYQRDVAYSMNFVPVGRFRSGSIVTKSGQRLEIRSSLGNVERLMAAILRGTLVEMIGPARNEICSGGKVKFGALEVDSEGLKVGKKALPWYYAGTIEFNDGKVIIRDMDRWKWWKQNVKSVPNVHVLQCLFEEIAPKDAPE